MTPIQKYQGAGQTMYNYSMEETIRCMSFVEALERIQSIRQIEALATLCLLSHILISQLSHLPLRVLWLLVGNRLLLSLHPAFYVWSRSS